MPATRRLSFLGRARERQRLDGMLAQARDGQSAVLVIRGEPGIGKSALLRYAAREASGLRTVEIEGVQAEMELPFAGIQRLSALMPEGLEALRIPQRSALEVALGVAAGAAPDKFLVAVAVLGLLSWTADVCPLLCLVDDAQWLDATSVQVLGFVARRLMAERVAMVFAVREPVTVRALDGLPDLLLEGLDEPDARALMARAVPGPLDDRVADRIVAESGGNPLALVELSRSMTAAERSGGFAPAPAGDLPSRLEASYADRFTGLPDATQRLMLLAAADPLGDAPLLWRAAERVGTDPSALAPARAAGMLEIDDRVRFHHPLVRSAVYRGAAPDDRQRAHAALAEASDPELAPDRRAWHRALAATGPDEAVAAELERSAGRAQGRGGLAAAAALLERAAALTPDTAMQAARELAAAEASFQAGELGTTQRLLATATSGPLDRFQSARAALLRGHAAVISAYGNEAPPLLLDAARRLEPFDDAMARRAYLTAWSAAITAHHLGGADVLLEISRAVRDLPPLPADPDPLDLVLEGLALLITDGHAVAMPVLKRAATKDLQVAVEDVLRWGWFVGGVRNATWDEDAIAVYERQARVVREAGALAELPIHLQALALELTWRGDLSGARALIAEAEDISAAVGNQVPPFTLLRVLALQGREAEASALIEAVVRDGTARGQGIAVMDAHWAAAVLYNGLGRHDKAASAALEVATNGILPFLSSWARFELVEAAVRTGETALARDALARLAEATQAAGTDLALGIEARCRALLADRDDAETSYREAIVRLGSTPHRPECARARLVYGEWLRREGRLGDAREQLRAAEELFADIGMEGFAGRARDELGAAGVRVRRRPLEDREQLSPQEEQIARLARDGLTNADIGARLFLSPRTVEWHLHKAFAKLGVKSRHGLSGVLPPAEQPA